MNKGKFIVFEGLEGAGKSTQILLLKEWLHTRYDIPFDQIITTRQPGGTGLGVFIKRLLLSSKVECPSPISELLLFASDRSQHMEMMVLPSLKEGKIILCDRYIYSTIAYQGYGRGVDLDTINTLNQISCHGVTPDLAVYLDVDVDKGFQRINQREKDRMEIMDREFYLRCQNGFDSQKDLVRIDANKDVATVMKQIVGKVEQLFL